MLLRKAILTSLPFVLVLASAGTAIAQAYPSKPVRIVVGVAAGGTPDIVARLIGQWLSERLGQQFIVDNRPGAGGNIATEALVKAAPDGHTLLMLSPGSLIGPMLHEKISFNFLRDVAAVAGVTRQPQVMVVHPSVPANTIAEFIAYAKANPAKLNFASGGIGTGPHLFGELFKMRAGVDLVHVPYRGGGPAMTDLIAGQVQVQFATTFAAIDNIHAGRLRALAVTSTPRLEALPDIPAMAEFIPGYETSSVFGIAAPGNTSARLVDKLNREVNAALADPRIRKRLADLGGTVLPGSPADFEKIIQDEIERWAEVIKFSGSKTY